MYELPILGDNTQMRPALDNQDDDDDDEQHLITSAAQLGCGPSRGKVADLQLGRKSVQAVLPFSPTGVADLENRVREWLFDFLAVVHWVAVIPLLKKNIAPASVALVVLNRE